MENLILLAALLACPLGMGLMMWFMSNGMRRDRPTDGDAPRTPSLDDLRAEQDRVGEEITRRERAGV